MRLADYGYKETRKANIRRDALSKALKDFNINRVKKALQSRKMRASGYKVDRLRADINWLEKEKEQWGQGFIL